MWRRSRTSITVKGTPWKQSLTNCASGSATRSLRRDSGGPWPAFPPSTRRRSTTPSSLPPRGEKTLRGMVLNMELGRFPTETAAFLRECPQARDMDILFNNELRSSRQTVAPQCFRVLGAEIPQNPKVVPVRSTAVFDILGHILGQDFERQDQQKLRRSKEYSRLSWKGVRRLGSSVRVSSAAANPCRL